MNTLDTEIRKKLHEYCIKFIHEKQIVLLDSITDSEQSLDSASNSTAGDKHDTSRAMMHLEIEKKSKQLVEIEKLKRVVNQINPEIKSNSNHLDLGSVVETNNGLFYIAINAGKIKISHKEFVIISLASPLAQALKNVKLNSTINFMNRDYKVIKIY